MIKYWVYILWSNLGQRFYTGITADLSKRLNDHNQGVSKWTKRFAGSWELVWQQKFSYLGEARYFENRLKRQKGGAGFYQITGLDSTSFDSSGS